MICNVCRIEVTEENQVYNGVYLRKVCRECWRKKRSAYIKKNRQLLTAKMRQYRGTKEGHLYSIYLNMRNRVNGKEKTAYIYKGLSLLPKKVFYKWALSNPEYHRLWDSYLVTGRQFKNIPSIDRIDSSKGYTLDNIQFLSLSQNCIKANKNKKKVIKNG